MLWQASDTRCLQCACTAVPPVACPASQPHSCHLPNLRLTAAQSAVVRPGAPVQRHPPVPGGHIAAYQGRQISCSLCCCCRCCWSCCRRRCLQYWRGCALPRGCLQTACWTAVSSCKEFATHTDSFVALRDDWLRHPALSTAALQDRATALIMLAMVILSTSLRFWQASPGQAQ